MQLEPIGFAKIQWQDKFVDTSLFDFVKEAIVIAKACGLSVQLFNFPTCTVPDQLKRGVNSISDWKQKYLDLCSDCSAKRVVAAFSNGMMRAKVMKSWGRFCDEDILIASLAMAGFPQQGNYRGTDSF